ncbi:MAG: ArsR/SmtB family transcription factor [Steroidobacteraceae bacterium]
MRSSAASKTVVRHPVPLVGVLHAQQLAAMQANANRVSDVLKAIANGARLMLVCQLAEGEKSVSQLTGVVGLAQSAVSQHLALLRKHHVVTTRRHGQSVYYGLASQEVAELIKTLHDQFCPKRC